MLATAEEQEELEAALEAAAEEAAAEDVEVDLSQQMESMASPSKAPAPKKPKRGGEGGSSSQAVELTETQESISIRFDPANTTIWLLTALWVRGPYREARLNSQTQMIVLLTPTWPTLESCLALCECLPSKEPDVHVPIVAELCEARLDDPVDSGLVEEWHNLLQHLGHVEPHIGHLVL